MKKYFSEYISYLLEIMNDDSADLEAVRKELLIKIGFMLIVTVLFALVMFLNVIIFFRSQMPAFLAIALLCLILLIFYIAHYFFLENGVQQLYRIYDSICSKLSAKK